MGLAGQTNVHHVYRPSYMYTICTDLTVFGVPLDLAIQRSLLGTDFIEIPTVFRVCIDFLEENGENQSITNNVYLYILILVRSVCVDVCL